MLLFGKDRGRYFPDAWIQAGRFRGREPYTWWARRQNASTMVLAISSNNGARTRASTRFDISNRISKPTLQLRASIASNDQRPSRWENGPATSSMSMRSGSTIRLRVVNDFRKGPRATSRLAVTTVGVRACTVAVRHHGRNRG